jgi:hypothetical protein
MFPGLPRRLHHNHAYQVTDNLFAFAHRANKVRYCNARGVTVAIRTRFTEEDYAFLEQFGMYADK